MRRARLCGPWALLFLVGSWSARAQDNKDPGTVCAETAQQRETKLVLDIKDGAQRLGQLERLATLYGRVKTYQSGGDAAAMGANFWNRCLDFYRKTFFDHVDAGHSALESRPRFHEVVGDFELLIDRKGQALIAYRQGATLERSPEIACRLKAARLGLELEARPDTSPEARAKALARFRDTLDPVIQDAALPWDLRRALLEKVAFAYEGASFPKEADEAWTQILARERSHPVALRKRIDYLRALHRDEEAVSLMRSLAESRKDDLAAQKDYVRVLIDARKWIALQLIAAQALKTWPEEPAFASAEALALAGGGGKAQDALARNLRILQKHPRSPEALLAQSLIHEMLGNSWDAQRLPGNALREYLSAIRYDESNTKLRIRAARMLFDHYEDLPQIDPKVRAWDMDKVLSLLAPLESEGIMDPALQDLYVSAATQSTKITAALPLCRAIFRGALGRETVAPWVDCATVFKSAGLRDEARELLSRALTRSSLSVHRDAIRKHLETL